MNYSELSDFEINQRVAILEEPELKNWSCYDISGRACFVINENSLARAQHGYSFTSDWADAGPIIAANKINILFDWNIAGIAGAVGAWPGQEYEDANPLRAAMIVYLMMQEQKA